MKNKTTRSLLFTALFLFFAGTGVALAETCEVPTSCNTDSGWNIELLEVTLQTADDCLAFLGIEECYRWRYKVVNAVGTTSGLTQLLLTIPTICDAQQPLFWGDEASPYLFDPGEGDPTSGFGKDIKSISVARFEPNSTGGYFSFYSPENTMTEATVAIAVKKGNGSCVIGGPSHYCSDDSDEILTVSAEQVIQTSDGERFWIIENPDTQCIKEAYKVNENGTKGDPLTSDLIENVFESKVGVSGNDVEYIGAPNQKCNRGIVKTKLNSWYFISGRYVWR